MKSKILLTAIFKDDSEFETASRMLDSFMPYMSGLCVALTGTSGKFTKLKKLIEKYKGQYVVTSPETHPKIYSQDPTALRWIFSNFAEARNACFELASKMQETGNYDWWSWGDVDDVLVAGEELDGAAYKAKEAKVDYVFFVYWYSIQLNTDGTFNEKNVVIEHQRERLLKPNLFKWVSRLHEVALSKDDAYTPKYLVYNFDPKVGQHCVWAHITDAPRIESACLRNIQILEIQAREEEHKDPRTLFYLAKTYYDMGKPMYDTLAEELLKDYLFGEHQSGWKEERANAWEYMGNIWARRGDSNKAIEAYHESIREYPLHHMAYLYLAREYVQVGLPEYADFYLDKVIMNMDAPKPRTTIGNPMQVKFLAASLKYNQCIRKLDLDGAIYWMKVRNEIAGIEDDGMLKTLEDARTYNQAGIWVFNYAKYLKDKGHADKITHLLQALTPEHKRESFVQYLANEVAEPKKWADNEIIFYASWGGQHFEEWDEKSLAKGIGGSETAVIELSKEWVKMGWKVTVFAECDDHEADGVIWKHWSQLNWKDEFNILILWRSPHLLEHEIKAKKIYMDLHDIASQLDWGDERMAKVDGVFFKSNWHRSHIPKLPDSKAIVISNGITL